MAIIRLPTVEARPADNAAAEFQAAARQVKRMQQAAARYAWATASSSATSAPPSGGRGPVRPQRTSRARLWAWYRATGKSWAQFEADHGPEPC